jgi:oxygen-independent coproporphyrinogen-3 oxidase
VTVAPGPPRSLYLHVPFCPHVCPYCDFHKMRRDEGLVARYLDRLEEEIAEAGARFGGPLDTLYLGGGTPSHLSDDELRRVFDAVRTTFDLRAAREVTLEADPATFDAERVAFFSELGVTRLSIGLQSTQDAVLRFLGRAHDARTGLDAVATAVASGLDVSADLILAVPGQDPAEDLDRLAATGVGHVSVYTLTIEPYTPFALRKVHVDEDRAADDYALAAERLARHGYRRYEVSNHARPGREAVHNQVYWHGAWFLGLGPSAAGYLPRGDGHDPADLGERVTNLPIKAWLRGDPPEREILTPHEHLLERLMTGLRTTRGVDLDALAARTGIDPRERFRDVLVQERAAGRLEIVARPASAYHSSPDEDARAARVLRATNRGLPVLDAILRRFFAA